MRKQVGVWGTFVAFSFLSGCAEKDTTAPPAPRVDPYPSPTSSAEIDLTGSAEYGATVDIKGGLQAAQTTADPFTALWRARVTLFNPPAPTTPQTKTLTLTATDEAGNTSDATTIQVTIGPEPGIATQLNFTLTGAAADGTIEAGEEITYTYDPVDAYGNPIADPILVFVNSPDAVVLDDGVSGGGSILALTRAGTYTLTVRAVGGAVDTRTVTVTPASGLRFVALTLTLDRMALGDTVFALTIVRDLYANVITSPAPALSIASQDPSVVNFCTAPCPSGNAFTITEPGVFQITATFNDGVNPAASGSAYILVERVPDLTPPIVVILNVTRNGFACPSAGCICTAANACIFAPGDDIAFDVSVQDAGGISQITYTAFFVTAGGAGTLRNRTILVAANTTSARPLFFFVIPGGAGVEDVDLVAQAIDSFGNSANSSAFIIQVRPITPVANLDGQTRTTAIVATSGPLVGNMFDAIYDGQGRLMIADNGSDQLLRATSPTNLTVFASFGGGAAPNDGTPDFLVSDLAGNIYLSLRGGTSGRVVQVDAASSALTTFVDLDRDVDTATNACDPGAGTGSSPEGLAVLPVRAARLRVNNPGPADAETTTVAGSATRVFEWDNTAAVTAGNISVAINANVCTARTNLRTAYAANKLAEVFAVDGPCLNGRDGDVALFANAATPDAVVTLTSTAANVVPEPNISTGEHLFVGGSAGCCDRYAHEFDLSAGPVPGGANTCYLARHDFGPGRRAFSIAPTHEGAPANLVVYAADRLGGSQILRYHVEAGSIAVVTSPGALNQPWDIVVAPSGCLLVSSTTQHVYTLNVRGGTGTFPLTPTAIVGGFVDMRGISIDSAEVIVSSDPASPATVILDARLAGVAGNSTPLADTEPNISTTAFSGGAGGVRARGLLLINGAVTDGNTVTVGGTTYELETNGTAVNASRPRVDITAGNNNAAGVATALALAIRVTDVRLLVTDATANTVVQVGPSLDTTDCF